MHVRKSTWGSWNKVALAVRTALAWWPVSVCETLARPTWSRPACASDPGVPLLREGSSSATPRGEQMSSLCQRVECTRLTGSVRVRSWQQGVLLVGVGGVPSLAPAATSQPGLEFSVISRVGAGTVGRRESVRKPELGSSTLSTTSDLDRLPVPLCRGGISCLGH